MGRAEWLVGGGAGGRSGCAVRDGWRSGDGHDRNLVALSITDPAARGASAMIVSMGLTPIGVGNSDASATIRRSASWTRPKLLVTAAVRSWPMRAVPIMWTVTTSQRLAGI